MSEKHTPGPWVAIKTYVFHPHPKDLNKGKIICRCHQDSAEANAHLIAAAPQLLAACKTVLREHEEKPFYESHSNADDALDACRAAIAKVEDPPGRVEPTL